MLIHFEDRPSDSPVVDRVWRCHSEGAGSFHSMATPNWSMVVSRVRGQTLFTIRGPETVATAADCPAEGEWMGMHFKLGSFMPLFTPGRLRDRNDLHLPDANRRTFQLDSSTWEYPDFGNAEVFVQRLVRKGLIVTDPEVVATLSGKSARLLSTRTAQRRFMHATGMTQATLQQIERARHATARLRSGCPIIEVTYDLGYYDQAHLTRSLKRFAGQTPAQIARQEEQLSLLYKPD